MATILVSLLRSSQVLHLPPNSAPMLPKKGWWCLCSLRVLSSVLQSLVPLVTTLAAVGRLLLVQSYSAWVEGCKLGLKTSTIYGRVVSLLDWVSVSSLW